VAEFCVESQREKLLITRRQHTQMALEALHTLVAQGALFGIGRLFDGPHRVLEVVFAAVLSLQAAVGPAIRLRAIMNSPALSHCKPDGSKRQTSVHVESRANRVDRRLGAI
jgi:hypothetical protein